MERPDAAITECQAIVQGARNDQQFGVDNWERHIRSERVAELLDWITEMEAR